ncbi:MAG: 4Fe-4S cluster-binding domain-containing protein [Lachnospiraceae bacterium]|nr:4Fe-4S cluster-binding domain-containing protein [Lachnospiraceae bacterium]
MKVENVIIWGAGLNGLKLKRDLDQCMGNVKVSFFCDNNIKKQGYKLDGIEILSYDQIIQMYKSGWQGSIIISVIELTGIVDQIRRSDLNAKVYGTSYKWYFQENGHCKSAMDFLYEIDIMKPRLDYYEYHVSWHCNLKCKGCIHFSNVAKKEFGDLEKYKKDICRLKELFWGVRMIRLMGGEPLLNRELSDFCIATRNVFPDSNIRVATNGLLIPNLDAEVLKVMSENGIGFDITQYPPTEELKERIELKCIESNVRFSMTPLRDKFYDSNNLAGDSDGELEWKHCMSNDCHFLEDGHIAVCALPILHEKYRSVLNSKLEICDGDIIDLYDERLDGFSLNDRLSKPIPMCRYCNARTPKWFEWQGNYPWMQ